MAHIEVYDNYDAKITEKYLNEFPEHDGVEISTDNIWDSNPKFIIEFSDFDEMEEIYEKAKDCVKFIEELRPGICIDAKFKYKSSRAEYYRGCGLDGILDDFEIGKRISYSGIENDESLEYAKKRLLFRGYEYRFPEIESEMTKEDVAEFFAQKFNNPVAVYRSGDLKDKENKDFDVYEDIYYYGFITFGNLYYLLKYEGYDVEGTVERYTVYDVNGHLCEFSYEFAGDGEYGTYYLVDGEVVSCDASYFLIFGNTIKDLFDLSIVEYKS